MRNARILKGIVSLIAMFALASLVVMFLWNWLATDLFKFSPIGYLQAAGLLAFCKILFKGGGVNWSNSSCQTQWKEKWSEMNPEQREKFRSKWESRCNKWSSKADNDLEV